MPSFSLLLHHRPLPLLCRHFSTTILSSSSRKPNSPSKNLLKAKDSVKNTLPSSLSSTFSSANNPDHLLPTQATGLVAAAQANFMRVLVDSPNNAAGTELLCVVRALLKKIKKRVLVGDRVFVGSVDWADRRGMIEDAFPRKTEVLDPPVANVDHLLVLFAMDQPRVEAFALTRFLVEAESTGIPLTLALNKSELVDGETISSWDDRLRSWGYKPLFCSVDQKHGLVCLEDILKGQTTVIVGPSGVGKSSLINSLRSSQGILQVEETNDLLDHNGGSKWLGEQRVNTVSKRSGRGKHTTRHVSLLPLSGGGYLCDTPGFNQPSLMKVTKRSLADTFPEIRQKIAASWPIRCSFNDCLHLGEPGCVVKADWERYPFYFQLHDEIKIREEFQLRTLGTKRESDVRYKVGDMGVKQAEPRLEPKKHRRVSRKRLNQSIADEYDEDDLEEDTWFDIEETSR